MKQKIRISDVPHIYIYAPDLMYGTIEEVVKKIYGIKYQLKEAYDIRKSAYPGQVYTPFEQYEFIELYLSNGNDEDELYISVSRLETDDEYDLRLKREVEAAESRKLSAEKAAKTRKENKEKRNKVLYEKLKKQYGS